MRIVRRIADLYPSPSPPAPSPAGRGGSRIGLVPTMGAFHEGHLSLMRAARKECDLVVTSLFVNPLQFGPGEDLGRYPRDEEADAALAAAEGVDVLFAPDAEVIVGSGATRVDPGPIATRWEGEHRPGHFAGVATIVAKLFNIVQPDLAWFGLKDFQQCAVVKQMVRDLNFPVQLEFLETVREPDGLAMSSRNRYLSPEERAKAPILARTLLHIATSLAGSKPEGGECDQGRESLDQSGFRVDYLVVVDAETLDPSPDSSRARRVLAAASLGSTRLIDNMAIPAQG